jgi:hypothetical protein
MVNWIEFGFSTVAVFSFLTVSGMIISILSTQLQCSKIGVFTSFLRGLLYAIFPTIVYSIAVVFETVRAPFASTLQSFGIPEDVSNVIGVGYLVMLASWISTVSNIHNSETLVCKPDVKEMTDFKKKLMAELAEKELKKEDNNAPKK